MSLYESWSLVCAGASAFGTLSAVGLAWYVSVRVNRRFADMQHYQQRYQTLTELRIKAFGEIAPRLNDLCCFFTYVGCWKEMTPPAVIALKRELDKCRYVYDFLLTPSFITMYDSLMRECFETYRGWGKDPLIRARKERRKQVAACWPPAWDAMFKEPGSEEHPNVVQSQWIGIMTELVRSLDLPVEQRNLTSGEIPGNIH